MGKTPSNRNLKEQMLKSGQLPHPVRAADTITVASMFCSVIKKSQNKIQRCSFPCRQSKSRTKPV